MRDTKLYFLSEQYFTEFTDERLMGNKKFPDGEIHFRPYFLSFRDADIPDIFWVVPISSKVDKYSAIVKKNIEKHGRCDKILIGDVMGAKRAFLIQNMCPVTRSYMMEYKDRNGNPVCINERFASIVVDRAQRVLDKARHGVEVIYPDVFGIYDELRRRLESERGEAD